MWQEIYCTYSLTKTKSALGMKNILKKVIFKKLLRISNSITFESHVVCLFLTEFKKEGGSQSDNFLNVFFCCVLPQKFQLGEPIG